MLKKYTKEEQAQFYHLTNEQQKKLKQVLEKYNIGFIGEFNIKKVNTYGTQFVNLEELPYVTVSNEKSSHVTMRTIEANSYNKNAMDMETGTIEFLDLYYRIDYIHYKDKDNKFCLQDHNNNVYYFKTISALFEYVRSLALAEKIGLVIDTNLAYIDDRTLEK